MREIKFRAWDANYKKMWFPSLINVGTPDGHMAVYACPFGPKSYVPHYPKDCILMEFAGLKEKNGVEICEGDIVRAGEFEGDHDTKVYEIVYNEDGTYPAFDLKGWRGETNGICFFLNDGYLEVIGNIYENPELLKTN